MKHEGHSEKRLTHKPRQVHDHDGEMARIEREKRGFGSLDGGGKSEQSFNTGEGQAEEYNHGETNY